MRNLQLIPVLVTLLIPSMSWSVIYGQHRNIGTPVIQNYPKEVYGGGTQNWDFCQDKRGVIYIANNEGLLEHKSGSWTLHPLPNKTIVRSVAIDRKNRLLAGGQDEFGYFRPNVNGILQFNSLKSLIPEHARQFEDVWDIIITKEGTFFRASDKIYHYTGDTIHVFGSGRPLKFLGTDRRHAVMQDSDRGMMVYGDRQWNAIKGYDILPPESTVTGMIQLPDSTLAISTENHGLYRYQDSTLIRWNIDHHEVLMESTITGMTLLPNGDIALGTARAGLIVIDPSGMSKFHTSRNQQLSTNHIRSLFTDRDGHVWLGLDNGINYVLKNSNFMRVIPDAPLDGTGYAAAVHNGQVYFGTSNGVYVMPWRNHYDPFDPSNLPELVPGTEGQVWGLDIVRNELLVSHHTGGYIIKDLSIEMISDETGHWHFINTPDSTKLLVAGTYQGIYRYRNSSGKWLSGERISSLVESSRIMATDESGNIWMSHPYRGVYRLSPEDSWDQPPDFYGHDSGLPSDENNFITEINDQIIVCAEQGVFRFDIQTDSFVPHQMLNNLLGGNVQVRYLKEDFEGNIWYALNDEVGVLELNDKGLSKEFTRVLLPELRDQLVGGFEYIYPADTRNVFIATDRGFIHYDPLSRDSMASSFHSIISAVHLISPDDSVVYGGHSTIADIPKFPHRSDAFRFDFSATWYETLTRVEYQYQLEGLEDYWSDWTTSNTKEYTNLPHGEYVFRLRSRAGKAIMGVPAQYAFSIAPPWYQTNLAYTIYGLLIITALAGVVLLPRRKYRRETAELRKVHRQKVQKHLRAAARSKEEIMRLKNEKLEAEVNYRNQELASSTMHLVQKNALLTKLGDDLKKIKKKSDDTRTVQEINKLINMLDRDNQLDEDWDQFMFYFDQVHTDFFKNLTEQFPDLTAKDHKMCAYLKLNLTSKEIAPLLNISVRGVEISRYRLRKKLGLESGDNLYEFLMTVDKGAG